MSVVRDSPPGTEPPNDVEAAAGFGIKIKFSRHRGDGRAVRDSNVQPAVLVRADQQVESIARATMLDSIADQFRDDQAGIVGQQIQVRFAPGKEKTVEDPTGSPWREDCGW